MTRGWTAAKIGVGAVLAILAVVATVGAWLAAPRGHQLGSHLGQFFGASAQVLAALLVALALFQSSSVLAGRSARRFLSPAAFPMLGAGLVASLLGLLTSLGEDIYRVLFALTVGTGLAGLVSVLLVGTANVRGQALDELDANLAAIRAKAHELDPDPPSAPPTAPPRRSPR